MLDFARPGPCRLQKVERKFRNTLDGRLNVCAEEEVFVRLQEADHDVAKLANIIRRIQEDRF